MRRRLARASHARQVAVLKYSTIEESRIERKIIVFPGIYPSLSKERCRRDEGMRNF